MLQIVIRLKYSFKTRWYMLYCVNSCAIWACGNSGKIISLYNSCSANTSLYSAYKTLFGTVVFLVELQKRQHNLVWNWSKSRYVLNNNKLFSLQLAKLSFVVQSSPLLNPNLEIKKKPSMLSVSNNYSFCCERRHFLTSKFKTKFGCPYKPKYTESRAFTNKDKSKNRGTLHYGWALYLVSMNAHFDYHFIHLQNWKIIFL